MLSWHFISKREIWWHQSPPLPSEFPVLSLTLFNGWVSHSQVHPEQSSSLLHFELVSCFHAFDLRGEGAVKPHGRHAWLGGLVWVIPCIHNNMQGLTHKERQAQGHNVHIWQDRHSYASGHTQSSSCWQSLPVPDHHQRPIERCILWYGFVNYLYLTACSVADQYENKILGWRDVYQPYALLPLFIGNTYVINSNHG